MGLEICDPLSERLVLAPRRRGHRFDRLELIAADEVHIVEKALDLLTHQCAHIIADGLQGAERAGGDAGEVVQDAVIGLHEILVQAVVHPTRNESLGFVNSATLGPPPSIARDGARAYNPESQGNGGPRMILLQSFPVIAYPAIDPVALEIGPFALRWYALAYLAGLLLGWRYLIALARFPGGGLGRRDVDDFLLWATLGVILGGRLGYAALYQLAYFAAHPLEIFMVWQGGMSFHGGLIGVILALIAFARLRGLSLLGFGDLVACVAPIGLCLGRLANFINGELYGRASELPWAMVFPAGGPAPRHPSQLYEALLEGVVLFIVLWPLSRITALRKRHGFLAGVFLAGYAVARAIAETFREPDAHIGYLAGGATMGQLLSVPLLAAGVYLMARARPSTKIAS
jgi:phosphatidylglycerol:prolipoprotein diacylglycerol transferase